MCFDIIFPIFLFFTSFSHGGCSPIKSEILKTVDEEPTEIQHAVCKVMTPDIEASAKATITKQLKGVCSVKDLEVRFEKLEFRLLKELQEIKNGLGLTSTSTKIILKDFRRSENILPEEYDNYADDNIQVLNDEFKKSIDDLKHLETDDSFNNGKYDVNHEIDTYNDTIVESNEGDLYVYYWKILDIGNVLSKRNVYISSAEFSVLGHQLYLQFYPNYEPSLVGILLKPLSNSFLKKHRFTFLGQDNSQTQISSKIIYGLSDKKPFTLSEEMVRGLIYENSLIVKVMIYLNS